MEIDKFLVQYDLMIVRPERRGRQSFRVIQIGIREAAPGVPHRNWGFYGRAADQDGAAFNDCLRLMELFVGTGDLEPDKFVVR